MSNDPSWQYFRTNSKNNNPETVFEKTVAKRLFCSNVGIKPQELNLPPNFPGIECRPIETKMGWASYQAKYSHDGKQNIAQFSCLEEAYKLKREGHIKLDIIYCYSAGTSPGVGKDSPKTKKQLEIEALAEKNGVNLVWFFEEEIIEQLRDDPNPLVIIARRKFFEDLPQPLLLDPTCEVSPEGSLQYHFSYRATPWTGREEEVQSLSEFLFSDEEFSWWVLLGKGGSGKSRLMLEVCNELNEDWNSGWLEPALSEFDFANWLPNKNTLIIVDYVIGQETEIRKLMYALKALYENNLSSFKVRLLLVEREVGQWLDIIKHQNTISTWIQQKHHHEEPLTLRQINRSALLPIAESLLEKHQESKLDPEKLVDKALEIEPERAPLIMQFLAISEDFKASNLAEVVRDFLRQDQVKRWNPAGIDDKDLDTLTIATMCGGIKLDELINQTDMFKEYFASYNDFEKYSIMTGGALRVGELSALEPDIVGEFFVLDRLYNLSRNPLSGQHKHLIEVASSINHGKPLVNFFAKCRQDYFSHLGFSALNSILEGPEISLIWLLTFANIIDVPAMELSRKINLYKSILNDRNIDAQLLQITDQIIFVRLLCVYATNARCKAYIKHLQVLETPEIPTLEKTNSISEEESIVSQKSDADKLLDELYSNDYCLAIIEDYRSLQDDLKLELLSPELVKAYHHKILRDLINRELPLQVSLTSCREIFSICRERGPHNYLHSIVAFQELCSNLVTALIQFNRLKENQDLCMQISLEAKEVVDLISVKHSNGLTEIVRSENFDKIILGITGIAARTRVRDYGFILEQVEELKSVIDSPAFEDSLSKYEESLAITFVDSSVQLAHGFRTQDDYVSFYSIFEKCVWLEELFDHPRIACSLSMILSQLCRNNVEFYSDGDKFNFLRHAVKLAQKFSGEEPGIIKSVILEISSQYKLKLNEQDFERVRELVCMLNSLLKSAEGETYSSRGRIWCGGFVEASLDAFVENDIAVDFAEEVLNLLHSSSVIAFSECTFGFESKYYARANKALGEKDFAIMERCKTVMRLLSRYLANRNIPLLLDALEQNITRRLQEE